MIDVRKSETYKHTAKLWKVVVKSKTLSGELR